jgi:hypothetical protein
MMEAYSSKTLLFNYKTTWHSPEQENCSEFYQIMRGILWNRVIPKQYKTICKVYIKLTYNAEIWTLVKENKKNGSRGSRREYFNPRGRQQ